LEQIKYDIETDVIVVGSGFAGLTAAIEAKNAGADVIVFEKMKAVGGNSIISDGGIAAPETDLQFARGIKDSKELMYKDIMASGLNQNDKDLVRILVDQSKEVFDWSITYLGVPYMDRVDQFGGHSVARCYTTEGVTGATIIKKLVEKVGELGIPILKQHYLEEVMVEVVEKVNEVDKSAYEIKDVIGARFRKGYNVNDINAGRDVVVKANKGLILATGGFGSDISFRMKYDGRLNEKIQSTNKPFATAEAMKEAIKLGADTVDLGHIQLGPWGCPDEVGYGLGPMFSEYIVFQYGLILDPKTGRRFINEMVDRKTLSDKMLEIGHPCIGIADQKAVDYAGWNLDKAIKKGVVKQFDTLEQLANYYDMPVQTATDEIEKFNTFIINKKDVEYDKPAITGADQVNQAPFYAMRLWPKVHFTMGGIVINDKTEVLRVDGSQIKGLYAVGEVTGGVHGASRLGSCAITECFVFGRIAGRNAVK
jgi:flavocytochrome c